MEFADVARTTFACRHFTEQAVTDDVLYRILDTARFAPSGGNRQGWKVIVVRNRATITQLVELSRPMARVYAAQRAAGENPLNPIVATAIDVEAVRQSSDPVPFVDVLLKAPVLLVVSVDLKVVACMDKFLDRIAVVPGASIYPFVWNLLLAARNEGLGGALTTFTASAEPDVQELLGLPSHIAIAGLLPLGYPRTQLTKLTRNPVESFATIDRYDGPPVTMPTFGR